MDTATRANPQPTPDMAAVHAASRKTFARRRAADAAQLTKAVRTVTAAAEIGTLDVPDHVRALVDAAPPLTPAQRHRLAAIITSPTHRGDAGGGVG